MSRFSKILLFAFVLVGCSSPNENSVTLPGITEKVEIVRDEYGINHIYAQNQHDLFYAQGYAAARDRLFQFEIWRRQATGTVAELLGPRELKRDIGTRLFKYRGDLKAELNHYHQDGQSIIEAYVDGVNAYIEEAVAANNLPVEFELLGTVPQKWTPEVVISRHQGLLGNITQELATGRAVAMIGAKKVKELSWFHPQDPILELDPAINGALLSDDILELYEAYRRPIRFQASDLVGVTDTLAAATFEQDQTVVANNLPEDLLSIGSNNWVLAANKTASGSTVMANDPHRTIAVPSLRYMVHLVAPGWNVIGGGEPEIPGISIGHNEYGAWGLTVFRTDGEDLYVYDLNPDNLNQYRYQKEWLDMETIQEVIPVKGESDKQVTLRYTRHGPVTLIDSVHFKAYAVRCAWMEPGGAPYLASLRMDQAKTWEEFRGACNYSNIPGENMIWADQEGNIGWQAVGIAPVRTNFSGMVPVPGDGRYEWDGYLPIIEKPHSLNPESGVISTANQNVVPTDYTHWDAIGYSWSDPYRGDRLKEVLSTKDLLTMDQLQALQTDYLSIPARTLMPYLQALALKNEKAKEAAALLKDWDFQLLKESIPAAIYAAWENELRASAQNRFVDKKAQDLIDLQLKRLLDWIDSPGEGKAFASAVDRDEFLRVTFNQAIQELQSKLGDDMSKWQYGQPAYKHITLVHPLGDIVPVELQSKLNLGPLPRGGNGYTPGSTSSNLNQRSGASFRIIVDTGDWDKAMGTNTPGQSGDPESPFYRNLFETWANDQYFPVRFSREKIEEIAVEKKVYMPRR